MENSIRDYLFAQHKDIILRIMKRNRLLLRSLGLEEDDVYQELAIAALNAIDSFDPQRYEEIRGHIWMKLQYAILDMRRENKPHGITGLGLTVPCTCYSIELWEERGQPLPAPVQQDSTELSPAMRQALSRLNEKERETIVRYLDDQATKRDRNVRTALDKIRDYYLAATPHHRRAASAW